MTKGQVRGRQQYVGGTIQEQHGFKHGFNILIISGSYGGKQMTYDVRWTTNNAGDRA